MKETSRETQPVRLPNPTAESFVASLKVVHFFAVFFFWLVLVALALHLAAFLAFQVGLFDRALELKQRPPPAAVTPGPETAAPAETSNNRTEPAVGAATVSEVPVVEESGWWTTIQAKRTLRYIRPLMATMRQVGLLASMLLLVTLFVYLEIALLGRLAGVRYLTISFFLVLFLVATVYSWEPLLAGARLLGSLYVLEDYLNSYTLLKQHSSTYTFGDWTLHYSRFLVMPVLSFVLLVAGWQRFRRGYVESVVMNE